MLTADPARNSTFTLFGDADYFFESFGPTTPVEDPGFAWNHGGIQPEVAQTWLGLVGPGVRNGRRSDGDDNNVSSIIRFSDETDIRPTLMSLLRLQDDYPHDGRVLVEALEPEAVPQSLRAHRETLLRLAEVYKQINAPFGKLGTTSLKVSTAALASNTPGDGEFTALDAKIAAWTTQRNAIAGRMRALLEAAAFQGKPIDEGQARRLIDQGEDLLDQVNECAANIPRCAQ
jgi:hypothetical protein